METATESMDSTTFGIPVSDNSLFKNLDAEELQVLSSHFIPRTVPAETVIFKVGDPGESCFIISSGQIEISFKDQSGEKIILATLGPGDILGELSLIDSGPRTATATAVSESELMELSRYELMRFLRHKPDAAIDLLGVIGARLRQANQQLRGRVTKNFNEEIKQELSLGQRIAWRITDWSGSFSFLVVNVVLFGIWIGLNINLVPGLQPFDPFPFGFLTMAVSLEAIVLSICVLLAQNLQAARERVRGDIEYDINLKAELEVSQLHEKVDDLHAEVLERLHRVEQLLRK